MTFDDGTESRRLDTSVVKFRADEDEEDEEAEEGESKAVLAAADFVVIVVDVVFVVVGLESGRTDAVAEESLGCAAERSSEIESVFDDDNDEDVGEALFRPVLGEGDFDLDEVLLLLLFALLLLLLFALGEDPHR